MEMPKWVNGTSFFERTQYKEDKMLLNSVMLGFEDILHFSDGNGFIKADS